MKAKDYLASLAAGAPRHPAIAPQMAVAAPDGEQAPAPASRAKRSTAAALPPSEADIQATIRHYLTVRGIPHTISNADQAFNADGQQVRKLAPGWPDLTGCWQGRLLAIECKSADGRLRPAQAETLARLWEAGAVVVIARSLEDVRAALERGTPPATKDEITRALAPKRRRKASR